MKTRFRNHTMGVVAALAGGALALGLGVAPAGAASVGSQLFLGQLNQWSDNSGESLGFDSNGNGFLDVGDTLRGTLQIGTVEEFPSGTSTRNLGSGGVNELSAIFEISVTTMKVLTDLDNSCNGTADCSGGALSGDETVDYTFGSYTPFATEFGLSTGTMVAFYEDPTPDYNRGLGTQVAIEGTVVPSLGDDSTLALELGFGVDADELWKALGAPTDPGLGKNVAQGTGLGIFNVQLSVVGVNTIFPAGLIQVDAGTAGVGGDGLIDFNGSGGISGTKGSGSFYDVFDNVDLVFKPIPEPATLGLLGLGLLGFGALAGRRRRRRTA